MRCAERGLEGDVDGSVARKVLDEGRELADEAGGRFACIDAQAHLASDRRRLEGGHLQGHELRLPCLLVVYPPLDDQHPVRLQMVARRRVRRVEHDDLGATGGVVESREDHGLATLGRHLLEAGNDPADYDDLTIAAPFDVGERAVGLAPELARDLLERVLGDVEAQRLLLEPEELALVELPDGNRGVMPLSGRLLGFTEAAVEDRCLPCQTVGGMLLTEAERAVEHREHPQPRRARGVERPAFDERLERAPVDASVDQPAR